MEGLFTLLVLSLLMAAVSFLVGSLPLSFSLSSSQLRLISALGMGVLVGTSLIIIIPEGVETLYSSTSITTTTAHQHRRDVLPTAHQFDTRWTLPVANILESRDKTESEVGPKAVLPDNYDESSELPKSEDGEVHILEESKGSTSSSSKEEKESEKTNPSSPHAWIGVALTSGFILMYLIDKLPQFASSSSKQQARPYHISLDNLGSGLSRGSSPTRTGGLLESGGGVGGGGTFSRSVSSESFATTTGLVIHAAADGIALGASTSDTGLSFIIFLAIMVHKAPAAFGLTSILLKQGLSTRAARGHLLIFSLAAPAGALVTWLVAHTIMSGYEGDEAATKWKTGMLLLFSGGTFLYVAMHVMQENSGASSRREPQMMNGYSEGRESQQRPQKSLRDLIASVVGMVIPLFLQIGHAH